MTTPKTPRTLPARGFTLLELLVGSVTTTIILSAVAVSFLGVQGSYQSESRIKVAVESLRTATNYIEQRLRLAGYGVDPRFAFDFIPTGLPGGTKSNYTLTFTGGVPPSVTDDLALRYRDPSWMRRAHYSTSTGLVLEPVMPLFGVDLVTNQRLLVTCIGVRGVLVLKVTAGVSKDDYKSSNFTVDTALSTAKEDDPCLAKTLDDAPYVTLLHELRIRITSLEGRPFLVAYQGFDQLSDPIPLAADVESFQVAYLMNRPPAGGPNAALAPMDDTSTPPNWVLGDKGSSAKDAIPDPNIKPEPVYAVPYDSAARFTRHPGNIRGVRLSITVRSSSLEPSKRKAFPRVDLEDSSEHAAADGYYRTTMTTTVRVSNMLSRSAFNPPVGELDAPPGSNVWGG